MYNEAEELFKNAKYNEAAKIFFKLAELTNKKEDKKKYLQKAADSYQKIGSLDEEAACIFEISTLCEGKEKVDHLVSVWRIYILAIAVYQYDTSFEWKGEVNNLNGSYEEKINNYYNKAVNAIILALDEKGVDEKSLLEILGNECVKRQNEGGWGSEYCWRSIHSAWNNKK